MGASRESGGRLIAIDWMRGIVMVLMAVDHASAAFNGDRIAEDSAWFAFGIAPLVRDQYLLRWVTHLCAPTFVFLAGTAIALSLEKRLARGERPLALDTHLVLRGLLLIALEVWMTPVFGLALVQVLYAIGLSLICMVALRRLPTGILVGAAFAWIVGGEFVTSRMGLVPPAPGDFGAFAGLAAGLVFVPTLLFDVVPPSILQVEPLGTLMEPHLAVAYPLLGWLPIMMLGWAFGRWLLARREAGTGPPGRELAGVGAALLALFVVVRGLNGYGNMHYPRGDAWWTWLHCSKYPPSLTYTALEGGLLCLILGWLFGRRERLLAAGSDHVLTVLGQTALFFYLLHIHLLTGARFAFFGGEKFSGPASIAASLLGAAAIVALLYPACRWFRAYKARHPEGWARYF